MNKTAVQAAARLAAAHKTTIKIAMPAIKAHLKNQDVLSIARYCNNLLSKRRTKSGYTHSDLESDLEKAVR